MTHKFDPKNISKLDNPERRKILPPREILLKLGLKSNDVMLDIGAGIGYFSFPAIDIVGERGKVVAADTSPEMIAELQSRRSNKFADNLETVLSEEYSFGVAENTFDFVLISLVFHEVEDKLRFIKAANSVLKKNGTLAIIEWIKQSTEKGPSVNDRIDKAEAVKLFVQANFMEIASIDYNQLFYFVTAKK